MARGRVNLYLDCKEIDPALLAREVIAAKMERQVIIYDDIETLKAVRASGSGALNTRPDRPAGWRQRSGRLISLPRS